MAIQEFRYLVDRWPARQGGVAECLPAVFKGRYVVITIIIRGSGWVCHPNRDVDAWIRRCPTRRRPGKVDPPRRIRKAAKMALRRVLGGS